MDRYVMQLVFTGSDGRWHLKHGPSSLAAFDTKEEAERAGQPHGRTLLAAGTDAQLVVHREDGSIEQEFTYGRDPRRHPG